MTFSQGGPFQVPLLATEVAPPFGPLLALLLQLIGGAPHLAFATSRIATSTSMAGVPLGLLLLLWTPFGPFLRRLSGRGH